MARDALITQDFRNLGVSMENHAAHGTKTDKGASEGKAKRIVPWIILFSTAVVTAVIIIALIGLFVYHMVDFKFLANTSCHQVNDWKFLPEFTYCFYSDKWNEETYLSSISSFYSTLITVLIAFQALISWVSFVVIRNSNKHEIESEVEKELPHYFKTKESDRVLREALESISEKVALEAAKALREAEDDAVETLQKEIYEKMGPQINGFKGRIEELEVKVKRLRNGDDEEGEEDDGEGAGEIITEGKLM